jgi:hypothetical protein
MPVLSIDQIVTLAANAGFEGQDLATAVAIALAESKPPGNSQSYNPEPGAKGGTPDNMGSYGLWQIYLYQHPEFAGQNLYDPQTNANAAYSVYSAAGQSFRPWTTYTHGKYLSFLNSVETTIAAIEPAQPAPDQTASSTDQGGGRDQGSGAGSSDFGWVLGGIGLITVAILMRG